MRGETRLGQQLVGALPDGGRTLFIEQFFDVEIALQLQVRPVIERIAQRRGYGLGPGLELVKRSCIPGALAFVDIVGSHGAPLVMVAFQPDFGQVSELVVFSDVARREVAVVIEDGLALGVGVKEVPRGAVGKQKVFVDKGHSVGASPPPIVHSGAV